MVSFNSIKNKAPVLILGGEANALSLIRSFGRKGILVRACMRPNASMLSRYCTEKFLIPDDILSENYFDKLLLGGQHPQLIGSVVLACSDDAVEYLIHNRTELEASYLLEKINPQINIQLLNKQRTLEIARKANIPTPTFWTARSHEDIKKALPRITYPVILKPYYSHLFQRRYNKKFARVDNEDELLSMCGELIENDIKFMISEMIPGPDDLGCSYYTYRIEDGRELFSFTKRCVRRYTLNHGSGTYQITENLPEVEILARKFFDSIDFRGIGNLEFKRDTRDNQLKVIECNTRFTAVQEQLVQSGVDAALITYAHITGQPVTPKYGCEQHVAIWSPLNDLRAFRQAKKAYNLSWADWFRSIKHNKLVFPYFSYTDPRPFLSLSIEEIQNIVIFILRLLNPRNLNKRRGVKN